MSTELWQFPFSHFNEKVRWALDLKGWPHQRHTLAPGLHVPSAIAASGQPVTPILVVDGTTHTDSTNILAFLERERPTPALYPTAPTERERALALEDWFDEEAGDDVRRLFYACYAPHRRACAAMSTVGTSPFQQRCFSALMPVLGRVIHWKMKLAPHHVARARERLPSFFDKVTAELQPSGYLVGEQFSVADLTAASMLSILVAPEQFPYALPGDPPSELLELRQQFAQHPGFAWVKRIYAAHRPTQSAAIET